jgi:hypothetical protein
MCFWVRWYLFVVEIFLLATKFWVVRNGKIFEFGKKFCLRKRYILNVFARGKFVDIIKFFSMPSFCPWKNFSVCYWVGEKVFLAFVRSVNSSTAHIRALFEPCFCVNERKGVGFRMQGICGNGYIQVFNWCLTKKILFLTSENSAKM